VQEGEEEAFGEYENRGISGSQEVQEKEEVTPG
jgi:hypothetical protein